MDRVLEEEMIDMNDTMEEVDEMDLLLQSQVNTTPVVSKKGKKLTSDVWKHFKRCEVEVDGKKVIKATCIYCKNEYNGNSASNGTGTLRRRVKKCQQKHCCINRYNQSTLHFNATGQITSWRYDPKVWRESLVRLIALCDLLINFGESSAYENHIKESFNPSFTTVSARTIRRDIIEYYEKRVTALKSEFTTSKFSVALTSDIWDSRAHLDYSSVVAHYIDSSWTLQKRIIGFRLVDRHTGEIIAQSILEVLTEYGLLECTLSITFDNASANAKAMRSLEDPLKKYNGGFLLHQRCACHVINLIVQAGLEALKEYVGKVRKVVSWIRVSNQRINAFKAQCITLGYKPRILDADMLVRWNSTYMMLKRASEYKYPLSQYLMSAQMYASSHPPTILTFYDWEVVEKIIKFLEIFYEATNALSGSYYPTSPLALHKLLLMAHNLYEHKDDEQIRVAVLAMKSKYLDYWKTPPLLYSLAFILDPRAKLTVFASAMAKLGKWLGIDYSNITKDVEASLFEVYSKYETNFGGMRVRIPIPREDQVLAWDLLGSCDPLLSSHMAIGDCDDGHYFELQTYLHTNFEVCDGRDRQHLNLLQWWEGHQTKYPVLSQLAKDVYTIPISTVSSKSVFSMAGRIVEERRARLTPEIVEMLTLIKDWELQDGRIEGLDSIEECFIDDFYEEDNPPAPPAPPA